MLCWSPVTMGFGGSRLTGHRSRMFAYKAKRTDAQLHPRVTVTIASIRAKKRVFQRDGSLEIRDI